MHQRLPFPSEEEEFLMLFILLVQICYLRLTYKRSKTFVPIYTHCLYKLNWALIVGEKMFIRISPLGELTSKRECGMRQRATRYENNHGNEV